MDLNPVAALIAKALIEIPTDVCELPPVNADARRTGGWWMEPGLRAWQKMSATTGVDARARREERIGGAVSKGCLRTGSTADVIAWLWASTVTCPNPACRGQMPLVQSFAALDEEERRKYVEPIVYRDARTCVSRPGLDRDAPRERSSRPWRSLPGVHWHDAARIRAGPRRKQAGWAFSSLRSMVKAIGGVFMRRHRQNTQRLPHEAEPTCGSRRAVPPEP